MVYRTSGDEIIQENPGQQTFTLETVNLVDEAVPGKSFEACANRAQSGFDLERGPLLKVVLFRLPNADRLLIIIHHLVVDGVSWRILLEDISTGYEQALPGSAIQLPSKTHSYKSWTGYLGEYGRSDELLKEIDYWRAIEETGIKPLPIENPSGSNLYKDSHVLDISLTANETGDLLTRTHQAYNTKINDILLTALARALSNWHGDTKSLMDIESHGREEPGLDISRTVGWFTAIFPIVLDISPADDIGSQVRRIKETLRQVPHNGIGYGILRYLAAGERTGGLTFHRNSRISFNYLGQFDRDLAGGFFTLMEEYTGDHISPPAELIHDLSFDGMVINNRFKMSVTFSPHRFNRQSIEKLLESFKEELCLIVSYCIQKEDHESTPGDLTYRDLSLDEFDNLLDKIQINT
jgi:non-ribosomal peptide synthase protein (TIGR01720 family)